MIETACGTDFRDGHFGCVQQMTAYFQTVMIQKINWALAKIAAENLTAFIAADFSGGGDLFQIDGFTVVAVGNHIALDQKIWIL